MIHIGDTVRIGPTWFIVEHLDPDQGRVRVLGDGGDPKWVLYTDIDQLEDTEMRRLEQEWAMDNARSLSFGRDL